ncbi:MAG: hypothetical protein QW470_00975 [Candidatus Caldarchaeum sp.]
MYGGRKAVSVVIASLVVTVVFLGLVSAYMAMMMSLQNSASEAIKREAERAMESFFMIYWLNDTHVRLFNNHSSVPVALTHWVTYDPAGDFKVFDLKSYYMVPPGTSMDVESIEKRQNLYRFNRVVSSRGSVFEVTDAPTELHTLFYFTPTERIVRPGFSGRLTTFVLTTGPDFGGGVVSVSCVNIFDGSSYLPCSVWSVSFAPSSSVNVQTGATVAVGVNVVVPATGTGSALGFYYLRIRLSSQSFTRDYSVRVIVSDFSVLGLPAIMTLNRAACIRNVPITVTTSLFYTGHIAVAPAALPPVLNFWADPNPIHPPARTVARLHVERVWTGPIVFVTDTLTIIFSDGLGPDKTGTLTVVHRGATALATTC